MSEPSENETQEERAIRTIRAIMGGANPAVEAETLANEFTDRQTARLTAWARGGRTPRSRASSADAGERARPDTPDSPASAKDSQRKGAD